MRWGAVAQYGGMAAALVAMGVVRYREMASAGAATAYLWGIHAWVFPPDKEKEATESENTAIFQGNRKRLLQAYVVAAGIVGVYLPLAMVAWDAVSLEDSRRAGTSWGASGPHTFLLLVQIVSEQASFTLPSSSLSPPARAMLPILYNSLRLPSLWDWFLQPHLPRFSFILAIANLLLWYFNLFCFLLPVYLPACLRLYYTPSTSANKKLHLPSTSESDDRRGD